MIRSKFLIGLILGIVFATIGHYVLKPMQRTMSTNGADVIAKVGDVELTREEVREMAKSRLAAVHSEEYRALFDAAKKWTREELLRQEAASEGITLESLEKEAGLRDIEITEDKILLHYNNNSKKYDMDYSLAKLKIAEDLYGIAYENKKEKFLSKLEDKHKVEINLQKPANYVMSKPGYIAPALDQVPAKAKAAAKKNSESLQEKSQAIQKSLVGLPAKGHTNSPITMVEYADFHCGFCKRGYPTVEKILENYEGKIRYVFRHFPLSNTPGEGSFLSHQASMCARAQDKFWEYSNALFTFKGTPAKEDLHEIAKNLKLDSERFSECLESGDYVKEIQADKASGVDRGVRGTPTFFFNEERISGALPYDRFEELIEGILDPSKKKAPSATPSANEPAPAARAEFNDMEGRRFEGAADAEITLVEFSDFHCPFCKRVTPTIDKLMEEYDGKIKRVFRHFPLPMHAGAEKSHEASECAGEQGKFWEYHNKLFENVGGYRTNEARTELAETIGLDKNAFKTCLESGRYTELVQKDIAKGRSVGVTGTPASYINGVKVSGARPYNAFKEVVDALLAGKEPEVAAPQKNTPPPAPAFYEFKDLSGKPAKGPENAPVTIVEFSDFHCPFCARVQGSLKQVIENYGDQVRIVWRHFPLAMHAKAPRAHEASQCAFEQGKFWEFHNLLFENMSQKTDEAYIGHAEKLGLDMPAFKQCLETGKYAEYIKEEVAVGQKAGVRGTPGFFINGKSFRGAQPYERFKAVIDEALKS